jgi:DNA repair protein RadC
MIDQDFQIFDTLAPREIWVRHIKAFAWAQRQALEERVFIVYLGADCAVQAVRTSSPGSPNSVCMPIRDIVGDALRFLSHAVVIAHNHPSGWPAPSRADIEQTRQLARVLLPLGIALTDHMIVAGDQYYSFRNEGLV